MFYFYIEQYENRKIKVLDIKMFVLTPDFPLGKILNTMNHEKTNLDNNKQEILYLLLEQCEERTTYKCLVVLKFLLPR
jgi:hypothetical protein